MSRRISQKIAKAYEYDNGKVLGGKYVEKNRKFVLNDVPVNFLKESDSLILVEQVVYLEDYYSCALFGDSLKYFYQAKGLEDPINIDLRVNSQYKPELALYIYNKVKNGELKDILNQGRKVYYSHPSGIFLTLIKKDGKAINITGYDLYEFVPKEKIIERDSVKQAIRQWSN